MKHVEEGVPLEAVNLSMCSANSHDPVHLLSEIVVYILLPMAHSPPCHGHVMDWTVYDKFFCFPFSLYVYSSQALPLIRIDSYVMTCLLVHDSFLGQRS